MILLHSSSCSQPRQLQDVPQASTADTSIRSRVMITAQSAYPITNRGNITFTTTHGARIDSRQTATMSGNTPAAWRPPFINNSGYDGAVACRTGPTGCTGSLHPTRNVNCPSRCCRVVDTEQRAWLIPAIFICLSCKPRGM